MSDIATGVHPDMPEDTYHGHPTSLSHSGARLLLPPSCPAKYAYEREHGRAPKKEWDLGHAAHKLVLGVGAELAPVAATDWRTKAAKEQRDAARAAGKVPVLVEQYDQVQRMADAVRKHPYASRLLDPDTCRIEHSVFWQDDEHGVWRRARLDAWGEYIVDYKSTSSAEPGSASKSMANFGYHMQADWYLEAATAVGEPAKAFLLVFQETEPPYLVTVAQPDVYAVRIGRDRNRRALEIYRDCVQSGQWPGYSDDVVYLSLPRWAERQHEEFL